MRLLLFQYNYYDYNQSPFFSIAAANRFPQAHCLPHGHLNTINALIGCWLILLETKIPRASNQLALAHELPVIVLQSMNNSEGFFLLLTPYTRCSDRFFLLSLQSKPFLGREKDWLRLAYQAARLLGCFLLRFIAKISHSSDDFKGALKNCKHLTFSNHAFQSVIQLSETKN